jgi:ketosteroid isomerase-like protein
MAEGAKEKIGEVVGAAKAKVSGGGPPVATDVEGRVQIVRDALKAFGNGDHDAFVGQLHEEVEWDSPLGGNFPGGGEVDGHKGLKEKFMGDIGRTYSSFGFRPSKYLETDDEDTVVVIGQFVGEGVKGDNVDVAGVQIWTFESGKAVRIQTITDSAAFPTVVTEADEEEENEQEEKEKQEKEQAESSSDESSDSGDESDSEGDDDESRDDGEGESRDESESHDDDESRDDGDESREEESRDEQPQAEAETQTSSDDDASGGEQRRESKGASDELNLAVAGRDGSHHEAKDE